jgi:hypothetical protein
MSPKSRSSREVGSRLVPMDAGVRLRDYRCVGDDERLRADPEICRMLGMRASVKMDGTLEVGGMLVEEAESCPLEMQYSTP